VAIALTIIRNKPAEINTDEYLGLLRLNFRDSFLANVDKIDVLKSRLLEANKQIFRLKHKEALDAASSTSIDMSSLGKCGIDKSALRMQRLEQLADQFESNVEFLTSVVKLKLLDKGGVASKLHEINNETVVECLGSLLTQISHFLLNSSRSIIKPESKPSQLKKNENETVGGSTFDSQFTTNSYLSSQATKLSATVSNVPPRINPVVVSFPVESILHSAQLFVNVYEIEWFLYSRNALMDQIARFVDDIVRFILNFESVDNVSNLIISVLTFTAKKICKIFSQNLSKMTEAVNCFKMLSL
jgi:hypothetical protein